MTFNPYFANNRPKDPVYRAFKFLHILPHKTQKWPFLGVLFSGPERSVGLKIFLATKKLQTSPQLNLQQKTLSHARERGVQIWPFSGFRPKRLSGAGSLFGTCETQIFVCVQGLCSGHTTNAFAFNGTIFVAFCEFSEAQSFVIKIDFQN